MKKIHIPLHKLIGILLLIGAWCFTQSRFAAQAAMDRSWMIHLSAYKFCRIAIYGMVGASLALLAIDAKKTGFRLRLLPLILGTLLLLYAVIDNIGTIITMNLNGQYDHFPQWISTFSRWLYVNVNPVYRASVRLGKHFSGDSNFTYFLPALQHILDLLSGFLLTRGIFGAKEVPIANTCDKEDIS